MLVRFSFVFLMNNQLISLNHEHNIVSFFCLNTINLFYLIARDYLKYFIANFQRYIYYILFMYVWLKYKNILKFKE
jgi:hypothetical protein